MTETLTAPASVNHVQPEIDFAARRDSGVLEIPIQSSNRNPFKPKTERSMPTPELTNVPLATAAQFVVSFNASQSSHDQKRAAILTNSGVLILNNVSPENRPSLATGFPPATETGLTQREAQAIARDRNAQILKFAREPRIWNVVLRNVARELGASPVAVTTEFQIPMSTFAAVELLAAESGASVDALAADALAAFVASRKAS